MVQIVFAEKTTKGGRKNHCFYFLENIRNGRTEPATRWQGKLMAFVRFSFLFFISATITSARMKIETKFSIGDSVWVMKDNKPQRFPIFFINVSASGSMNAPVGINPVYATVRYSSTDGEFDIPESACYASKEELLASL